jgi:hypothetical protein
MHYHLTLPLLLLLLTAFASAIDIHDYPDESHCAGGYALYRDAKPDTCYHWGGDLSSSFGFYAIPKNWRISTRSHIGGSCHNVAMVRDSNGRDSVCHGAKKPGYNYTGAGYSFINGEKRGEVVKAKDGKRECRGPDAFVYEGGPTYELGGVDEETVQTMVSVSPAREIGIEEDEDANRFCSEKHPNY